MLGGAGGAVKSYHNYRDAFSERAGVLRPEVRV